MERRSGVAARVSIASRGETDDCLVERLLASVLVSQVGWPQKIKALRFVSSRFLMSISQINMFVDCVEQAEDVSDRLTSHKVRALIYNIYNASRIDFLVGAILFEHHQFIRGKCIALMFSVFFQSLVVILRKISL